MKYSVLIFTIAAILFSSCGEEQAQITVSNQSDNNFSDKGVIIERPDIEIKYGAMPEGAMAWLEDENGERTLAQLDDLDGDMAWDELYAQIDLKAGESKSFYLIFDDHSAFTDVEYRTNIRFADISDASKEYAEAERLESTDTKSSQKYFQFEGPGWENDIVGFRNYFDARNGIDIFGKRTSEMVLDQCGLADGPTYHELQPWGMDILKVGSSLGAGAIAIQTESGLHRVGPKSKGTFTLVKEGPLRSIIDLDFEGMMIDNNKVDIKHRISIAAGDPFYQSEVYIEGVPNAHLVTGIVNLDSDEYFTMSVNGMSAFYTHDNQAYEGEKLGLAVIAPQDNVEVVMAPEEGEGITQTFYTAFELDEQPVKYYFMASWEKQNKVYATQEGFEQRLSTEMEKLLFEIDVKI
ncbi:MAG: DUF4861 domain-containing protein [Prolixibacteraceae bacterium]|nr:DUF4861 domain-containing protein [Prolixibacteraceae bacterium]